MDLYVCIQPNGSIVLQGIANESTKELHVRLSNLHSKELKDQIAVQRGLTYSLKEQFAWEIEETLEQLQTVADKVSAVLGTTLRTVDPHQNFTKKAKSVNSQGEVVMYYNLLVQNARRTVTSLECDIQEQLLFEESPIQALKQMPQAEKEPQPEPEPGSKHWATASVRNEAKGESQTNESSLTSELRSRSHALAKAKSKVEGKKPANKVTKAPSIEPLCFKSQPLDSPSDERETTMCIDV